MLKTDITEKQYNRYHNIVLSGTPLVSISKTAWDKIKYLCRHINTVEWSGCIFYKFTHENPSILSSSLLNIEIVDLIPLDKGSESFTEYTFDARVLSYMTDMNYFDLKIGHCHSHHNMKTFFSGTDLSELNDNSEFIKPYLSLIVNNAGEFSCRLATRIEKVSPEYRCQDINNNEATFKINDNNITVAYYECSVVTPQEIINVSDKFITQYENIIKVSNQKKQQMFPKIDTSNNLYKNYRSDATYADLFDTVIDNNSHEISMQLTCYLLRLGNKIENDTINDALEDITVCIKNNEIILEEFVHSLTTNIRTYIDNFFDWKHLKEEQDVMIEEFADSLAFDTEDYEIYEDIIEYIINELTSIL